MKKSLVAILIYVLVLPLTGCGYADSSRVIHNPDGDTVAKLTVYATSERGKVAPLLAAAGHAYASIENVSDGELVLGKGGGYTLPAGATVTIGAWELDAHAGVWYNLEPTYIDQGWYAQRKSITREIDEAALLRINEFLSDDDNDMWTVFRNCTHFVTDLWNEAANGSGDEMDMSGKLTPAQLISQIKEFEGWEVGKPHISSEPIGYYVDGTFKEFKPMNK